MKRGWGGGGEGGGGGEKNWINWENWVGGEEQFFKKIIKAKEKGSENAKFLGVMECFHFNLLTIGYFRKYGLENLFLKVVIPGISKHWSYHTGVLVFYLKFTLLSVASSWTSTIT